MIRSFQRGAGGNGGTTITLQNVKSNTPFSKETKSAMPTARYKLTSSAVNGLIYCIGGRNDVVTASNKNEAYDPKTDTWATKTNLPIARYGLSSAVVDGIIYCIGGILGTGAASNKNEAYDPLTDSWTTRTAGTARRDFGAVAVNGIIYCIGGKYGNDTSGISLTLNQAYDPKTDTWATKAFMNDYKSQFAIAAVDGVIYCMDGFYYETEGSSTTTTAYDIETDTWTKKASKTTGKGGAPASVIDGSIYVLGGKSRVDSYYSQGIFLYHPDVNVWTVNNLNILSEPRADATSCVVDEIIYLIGGASGSTLGSTLALNEAIIPEKYIKKYKVYGKYSAKFDKDVYVGDKLYAANTLIEGEDDTISFKVTDVSGSITVNDALITKL